MTEKLNEILNKFGINSTFSKQLFIDKSFIKEYSRLENIFIEGKKNDLEYILLSGVLHRFNYSDKGDMVTTGFYTSQSVITPHFARTHKGESIFSLQSLTEVTIAEISVKDLDNLRLTNKEFNEFGRQTIETELALTYFNQMVFRSYSAKERLLIVRKQYKNLENLIPNNIIASYLGITNVSFSRLRNELSKQ